MHTSPARFAQIAAKCVSNQINFRLALHLHTPSNPPLPPTSLTLLYNLLGALFKTRPSLICSLV